MFLNILIPYSRFSGIDETTLDGFPARVFQMSRFSKFGLNTKLKSPKPVSYFLDFNLRNLVAPESRIIVLEGS